MADSLIYRLLGPLEVTDGDELRTPTAPRLRTLLAVLVARANSVVSRDELIEELWGEDPPDSATNTLQVFIRRLRRTLAPHHDPQDVRQPIRTAATGYLLRAEPAQVDAAEFTRLAAAGNRAAAAGDAQSAAQLLRAALAMWRGPALADVDAGQLLQPWAVALQQSRLDALEARIEAELRLGRHRDVVAELQTLIHEHPLREGYWRQAMLALYRCGRKAEALALYRRLRARLVHDLGVEPGAEVARTHQAILAGDAELDHPTADVVAAGEPPAQLPTGIADFTGRQVHLETVCATLRQEPAPAAAGASRVVVISGRAGVGKSALAVQAAHRVRAAFPDGQLYAVLRGADGAAVPAGDVLAWFLRALGSDGAGIPDTEAERIHLYRSRLAGRRVLVVLDNAVDVGQVRPLLPGGPGPAVLVTSRQRLSGLEGALDVELPLLDPSDAVNLLRQITGAERIADDVEAAEHVAALCGQLPLAVRVAGAKLASRPHWSVADLVRNLTDERQRLAQLSVGDLDVRSSFGLSYEACDEVARRAFRLLSAVPSRDFPVWVAAAVCGVELNAAESAVEQLVDAQLLQVAGRDDTGGLRYQFHDLFRLYAAERVEAEDGPAVCRDALVRVLTGYCQLARHADEALRPGRLAPTLPSQLHPWQPPDEVVAAVRDDPVTWFAAERTALVDAVVASHGAQLWALTWCTAAATVGFFDLRSYWDDWRRVTDLAVAAAEKSGDQYALALARYDQVLLQVDRGVPSGEPCTDLLRDFIEQGRHREAAHVRYEMAMQRLDERRTVDALWYARAALRGFAACGDRRGEAFARRSIGNTLRHQGAHRDALRYFNESLALFRELGDRRWEAYLLLSRAGVRVLLGEVTRAGEDVSACLEILRSLADRRWEAYALRTLGDIRRQQERYADAAMAYQRGLAIMRRLDDRRSEGYLARNLGDLYRAWGRLAPARALLERSLEIFTELGDGRGRPLALLGLAGVARAEKRYAEAVTLAERALAEQRELSVPLWEARALTELGEALAAAGDAMTATEHWREALEIFESIDAPEADQVAALLERWGAADGDWVRSATGT